ncbi:MAG: hypothetical protein ACK5PC_14280 [Cyclobacteriaceae bacterium]|jgi:hypothetical protein|nr:hypothetical protein [Flammeovirgaceae bacterium]
MLAQLARLTPSESDLVLKAPLLVCILIAGADNDIDRKEIRKAIDLANKKQKRADSHLVEFYKVAGEDFEDKLKVLIQSYPYEATQRNPLITMDLQELNNVLRKIDKAIAMEFYQSLREIAQKIAESSGGLLGMKSIGNEEAKYVNLPMIIDPSSY